MARFITIFAFLAFALSCARSEDLFESLNFTSRSAVGFDELYNDALNAYKNEDWKNAVKFFQQAIADYRHEQDVNVHCRVTCREIFSSQTKIKDLQLQYFKFSIYNRECVRRCVEKYRGKRSFISKYVREAFEVFQPYGYLQLAYYKNGQPLEAVRAAYTFLEKHPKDDTMLENMKFYKRLPEITDDKIISFEPIMHQEHYFAGAKLYERGYWQEAINEFELALKEYWKAYAKCQMLCEEKAERNQILGRGGLFGVHVSVIECRTQCPNELVTVKGHKIPNYLARHYNYLQLSYFKLNDLVRAAECVITYLLFNPSDDTMIDNMRYYRGFDEVRYGNIRARKDAEQYHRTTKVESNLLHIAQGYLDDGNDEEFDDGDDTNEQESPLEDLAEGEDEDYTADSLSGLGKPKDLSQMKKPEELVNDDRFKGVKLVMKDKELNGSARVLVDGMATEEQCKKLMELARKTAKLGDGYTYGQGSPFTTKEHFEGVTIKAAAQAVKEQRASFDAVELYANLSEKMREFVEEYFQMETPLYVSYIHLVCRTSLMNEDGVNEPVEHLSHPIHSDNCLLHRNGPGTCPKRRPAYTWRDYSAILYLNGDFEGGNFIFAHSNDTIQAQVKPECGRLVAFSAGFENLHGVLGIKKGRRCALPIWFTLRSRNEAREDSHEQGLRLLDRLRKERIKSGLQSGQRVQFESMGSSHTEL